MDDRAQNNRVAGGSAPVTRYLVWAPGGRFGGCESYARSIAEFVRRSGWEVTILCSHRQTADAFRERLPEAKIVLLTQFRLPVGLKGHERIMNLVESLRCGWYLLGHRPDIVHAALPWHIHSIGFVKSCTWLKLRALVTIQLCAAGHVPGPHYIKAYRSARDAGIRFGAISEDNRRLLQNYYGLRAEEVPVIRNRPLLSSPPALDSATRSQLRRSLDLADDQAMILTVGQFFRQKGYDLIIRAIPEIVRRFPQVVFVWAGEGEERQQLEALADRVQVRDRIRMLGWRDDVPALLRVADVFLFPTRYEGESFAVLEAVVAGVPVVASNASGIPELLRDGEDALLFPVDDVEGLIAGVIAVLDQPAQAAARVQRAKSRLDSYTHQNMLEDTLALLQDVAQVSAGEGRLR